MSQALRPEELQVASLGPCDVDSPLRGTGERFVSDETRVLVPNCSDGLAPYLERNEAIPGFEEAGPRARVFFEPKWITCGIVTCGGLCPGLNDVVRAITITLKREYGVPRVLGFRYGFAGLAKTTTDGPIELTVGSVDDIHREGGTVLGSSRGPQDVGEMVDSLTRHGVRILFTIGGDGTQRGASAIAQEIARRELKIAVIGIPKTIDNDIANISMSFGFATAVEEARRAILGAHSEAKGAKDGIGIVKLMGRHSGFIAAHATLANSDVNFCLVPEVPFAIAGDNGLLGAIERRLADAHHAVILAAEGAGQELLEQGKELERDASGNVKLGDIGVFLRDEIKAHFKRQQRPITVKYIDPSYIIRSLPANSLDSELCLMLGQHAAHAGIAGRTDMMVGVWNHRFTHIPIHAAVRRRKQIDPHAALWHRVLEATGQPACMS